MLGLEVPSARSTTPDSVGDALGTAASPMFRMPTGFGPAAGPRNVPADRQRGRYVHHRTALTVTALSDSAVLNGWLPPGCTQVGAPLVSVNVTCLRNLGWLAGRGYNIVLVTIHNVVFRGATETIEGSFIPVIWESRADPIITGREELGMPKIFADIPDHVVTDGRYDCSAWWDGFPFFEMTASDLVPAAPPPPARPLLSHKYIPRTGDWGEADVDYVTTSGRDPNEPVTHLHDYRTGSGSFRFKPATWEQMPTQHEIVNALSALPIDGFVEATLRVTSQGEVETAGGGNLCGHRIAS